MVWASAVTWHNPIPTYGRLAELACTGAPSARLLEHFGGNWVMPLYASSRINFPRPCSPIWNKWTGSSGQTPCPCPTCPTKIWRPPSPCPTCPTYSNLSQLVPFGCTTCPFPSLVSQIFFWISHCHCIFRKTLMNEKFSSKYYHVRESVNNKKISTKRQETTMTIHSNTWVYFV